MHWKLRRARIATDANSPSLYPLVRHEAIQYAIQKTFGDIVFAEEIQRIIAPPVKRILDEIPIGREQFHLPVVCAFEKNASARRNRVERYGTVRRNDDLEVVTERQLLQLQHKYLLNPRMQARFHFVNENKRVFELRYILG